MSVCRIGVICVLVNCNTFDCKKQPRAIVPRAGYQVQFDDGLREIQHRMQILDQGVPLPSVQLSLPAHQCLLKIRLHRGLRDASSPVLEDKVLAEQAAGVAFRSAHRCTSVAKSAPRGHAISRALEGAASCGNVCDNCL